MSLYQVRAPVPGPGLRWVGERLHCRARCGRQPPSPRRIPGACGVQQGTPRRGGDTKDDEERKWGRAWRYGEQGAAASAPGRHEKSERRAKDPTGVGDERVSYDIAPDFTSSRQHTRRRQSALSSPLRSKPRQQSPFPRPSLPSHSSTIGPVHRRSRRVRLGKVLRWRRPGGGLSVLPLQSGRRRHEGRGTSGVAGTKAGVRAGYFRGVGGTQQRERGLAAGRRRTWRRS